MTTAILSFLGQTKATPLALASAAAKHAADRRDWLQRAAVTPGDFSDYIQHAADAGKRLAATERQIKELTQ